MKKHICIILAFQVLATSSPGGQGMHTLLKMGAFLQHFAHHILSHQENIGILDFVHLHYSDHEHHDEDHAEHENLPFQHHHHDQQIQVVQSPCLLPQPIQIVAFQIVDDCSKSLIPHSQQRHSSSFLDNIWQPPKA